MVHHKDVCHKAIIIKFKSKHPKSVTQIEVKNTHGKYTPSNIPIS